MKRFAGRTTVFMLLMFVAAVPVVARPLHQTPIQPQPLTPELLAAIVGTAISLFVLLVPKLNVWFVGLAKETQQSIMALVTTGAAIVIYLLACTPSLGFPYVACPEGGIWSLLSVIIAALVPNQTIYRVIPAPQAVTIAKAEKAASLNQKG